MHRPAFFQWIPAASIVLSLAACCGEDADFRKAQGYYTLTEYRMAADAFDKFLADYSKSERADQARLLLAESRYQLKEYKDAAESFERFLSDFPSSPRRPDALLRALKVHFLLKDYAKSLSACEKFLNENRSKLNKEGAHPQLETQIATALYYAGEDAFALKKPEEAKAHWEDLIQFQPKSALVPDASNGLGWIGFDAKDYEHAIGRFQLTASAKDHPRAAASQLMAGRCYAALNKTGEALAAFNLVPTLTGGKELEAEALMRSAEVLSAANKHGDALTAWQRLAKEFPASAVTAPALAAAVEKAFDAQRWDETESLAAGYLDSQPQGADRPAILRLRARSLGKLNKMPEAAAAAKSAVDEAAALADPARKAEEHSAALLLMAELLSGPARTGAFNDLIKAYPESSYGLAARYELARSESAADLDKALQDIRALLDLLAAKPPGQKELANLRTDALFAAADFAFRKSDYKQTEEFLQSWQKLADTALAAKYADDIARKLAWCRYESGDAAGAAGLLDKELEAGPKSHYRDEMLYLRALAASKANQPEQAVKFDEMLAGEFPASSFTPDALFDAASILFKQNKPDAAIVKLSALIDGKDYSASPLQPAARQLRASALLQNGKAADALADTDALIKQLNSPNPAPDAAVRLRAARLLRAFALKASGAKESDIESGLSELILAGPPDAPEVRQAIARRGLLNFDAKKFDKAKEDFKTLAGALAAPLSADTIDAALRLALCHKELKEDKDARAILEKLSGEKLEGPAAFEVPFQLGNLSFETQNYEAAAAQYEKALAGAAKDLPVAARSAAQLNLAWSLKGIKKLDEAEKAFGAVLKIEGTPHTAEALYERGRILQDLGKIDDAAKSWSDLLEQKPESPLAEKALFQKGQVLAKSAKYKEGADAFSQYAQKFAAGPSLREAYCGLAECNMQLNNVDAAKEAFKKVLGEKGLDADLDDPAERALLGLSEISLKAGDALNAKKQVLRILAERPESLWRDEAYFVAAQSSEKMNEPEKAISYYRKLLAEHPKSTHADAATTALKALGAPVKE